MAKSLPAAPPAYPDSVLRSHGFEILARPSPSVVLWKWLKFNRVVTERQAREIVAREILGLEKR